VAEEKPNESDVNEQKPAGSSSNEEASDQTLNLADEASNAAANKPRSKDTSSLDDLNLDDDARKAIESYVSKSVNDAVAKHDRRTKRKAEEAGHMTRNEVETLLAEKDAESTRRIEARERFLSVLGEDGITPGSDSYKKVEQAYRDGIDDGAFTPQILLTEAGVRTLVAVAGVSSKTAERGERGAGPQSGLAGNLPEGSRITQGGDVQLNADNPDDPNKGMRQRMNEAMADALRKQS